MFLRCTLAVGVALGTAATAAPAGTSTRPAELYQRVCSACHGEKGDGRSLASTALRTSPRNFTTEEARTALSREYMIAIVRDGRPHTAMVGRASRLAQPEIEGVVDFIRTAFMPPEPGSPLALGRTIYLKSCASCHGDRGQGGAARGTNPASPAIAPGRAAPGLTPERMVEALLRERHVPGLPSTTPAMTADDARAAVAYIRTAFIEAAARAQGTPARQAE